VQLRRDEDPMAVVLGSILAEVRLSELPEDPRKVMVRSMAGVEITLAGGSPSYSQTVNWCRRTDDMASCLMIPVRLAVD